jgi:hypothetical protein
MRVALYALRIVASLTVYAIFMPLIALLIVLLWIQLWAIGD